jgi:D-glycerate 3-kinase
VTIPQFDKSAFGGDGDRTSSDLVSGVDIVLFEGWFVGMRPVDPAVFDLSGSNQPPSPIDTESERQFARDMNARLVDYLPLWDLMDRLMVLHPVDYRLSLQWRKDAERKMIEQGKSGMAEQEIEQFVAYFWRSLHPELFLPPLLHNPQWTDLVIELDANHRPGKIFRINHR